MYYVYYVCVVSNGILLLLLNVCSIIKNYNNFINQQIMMLCVII